MNERIEKLWSQAGGHYDRGCQHTWPQYTIDDPEKFAELIVKECALIAGLMEHEGRKNIGAQILSNFEIAESYHSDKGYSLGTPEAQEAFDSKRGYNYDKSN
jgi:hypothetical protein